MEALKPYSLDVSLSSGGSQMPGALARRQRRGGYTLQGKGEGEKDRS